MSKEAYFDRSMRGWICNIAAKEHRRLSRWYEIEDLIQEGYLCFCRCWDKYQDMFDVANPSKQQRRHFMSLVQTTFLNHLKNMIKHIKHEQRVNYIGDMQNMTWTIDEVATVLLMLRQAPAEIRDVVEKLVSDFEPGPYRRRKTGPGTRNGYRLRETTREYWDRVLGEPNVEAKLASYFVGN